MNKRGEERITFVWMFINWVIIAFAVSSGVFILFSVNADTREAQAEILGNLLSICFTEEGLLKEELFFGEDIDYFKLCDLNKDLFNDKKFYGRISFYDSNLEKIHEDIILGDSIFEVNCALPGDTQPRCVNNKLFVFYKADNNLKTGFLEIISGSNNIGEKI